MTIRKLNDYRDVSKFDETIQLSNNSDNIHIIAQDYAPATPAIGDLWIDTDAQSMPSLVSVIDLTSATADYPLAVGQTATITYTNTTSVPLHVETPEGLYELVVIGFNISGSVTDGQAKLLPNNTNTASSEVTRQDVDARSTVISSDVLNINYMDVGRGCVYQGIVRISTFKTSKTTISSSFSRYNTTYSNNGYMSHWTNTTAVWTSLGTITFPFAQSGKIVIRRII